MAVATYAQVKKLSYTKLVYLSTVRGRACSHTFTYHSPLKYMLCAGLSQVSLHEQLGVNIRGYEKQTGSSKSLVSPLG